MNLMVPEGRLDEASRLDGDSFFTGVNERLAPMQLPPGFLSYAENMRFRNGKAEPRLGIALLPWMKGTGTTPFTNVYGAAVFRDPNQPAEWILIAADGGVWKTQPNNIATAVTLPGGVTLTASTFKRFVQCMGVLILLRGEDESPLVMTDIDLGFQVITQTEEGEESGTEPIPNSSFAFYYANRLFVVQGRDFVAQSDVGDYTRYAPVQNTFTINEGEDDALVAIYPFGKTSLVMFKERRVWLVDNVYGDLSAATGPHKLTSKYGCTAVRSVVDAGSDLYWQSQNGIVSARLTELNQQQGTTLTLTDDLPLTMARLHPVHRGNSACENWDGKLYYAFCADDGYQLGANVASGSYNGGGTASISVTSGQKYLYTEGANETSLTNGATTHAGSVIFTASGSSVTLNGSAGEAITASIQAIQYEGVPNVVAVFDLVNQAWCGVDESEALLVVDWLKFTYQGRERLGFMSADGWLKLYEEGFEDEIFEAPEDPYVDISFYDSDVPGVGGTLQVNGGTIVVARADSLNQQGAAERWGGSVSAELGGQNLWQDSAGVGGYSASATDPWSAPNTTVTQIAGGVRFTATNGVLPEIKLDGVVQTTGNQGWAWLESHSAAEIVRTPIRTEGLSRGFPCADMDKKRYATLLLLFSTWAPTYDVSTALNGVANETEYVTDQTRSRTQYENQETPDWDESNVNDDHGTRGRQDYSVVLEDSGEGLGTQLDSAGVNCDLHQDTVHRVPIDERGHWCQARVVNTTGRLEWRAARMEALEGDHPSGVGL